MAKSDQKHPGVKRMEEFESLLTGRHTISQLEEPLRRLSEELDEPGTSDEAKKTAAGVIRARIKAIKKAYPDIVKRKEYLKAGYLLRGIEAKAQEIMEAEGSKVEVSEANAQAIESPEVDLDATWVERVDHEMRADRILNALYFNNEDEGLEGAIQKLNEFGYKIRSKEDLIKIVQDSVREALEMEIPEENVLNISNILMAMKNEGSLTRLKTKLESELEKTVPVPEKSEILKEIADIRTEFVNDLVLHAIYVTEEKKRIGEINGIGAMYDEGQKYSASSNETVKAALTKALGQFRAEFKLGDLPKNPLDIEAICVWIQKGKIKSRDLKALVAHIENELLNETKNPSKAPEGPVAQERVDKKIENMALGHARKEFGDWVMLFKALHYRNLPKEIEKAKKSKKNRENLLGTADEKSFHQLRSELEKGILRRFINAKDCIKAMEAMIRVEDLNEKNIKEKLAGAIKEIKLKIEEAKRKIEELSSGGKSKGPFIIATRAPTKKDPSLLAILPPIEAESATQSEQTSDIKAGPSPEETAGMGIEPKNNPEQSGRSERFNENIESIKKILAETVSAEEKSDYLKKLFELGIGMETTQPSHEPKSPTPIETVSEKPTVETIVKMLMGDKSLEALIQELEDFRLLTADMDFNLKFGLIPEKFGNPQQFKDTVETMVRAKDPILSADSIDKLLAAHVQLFIDANPDFLEAWDPNGSPEKMREVFGNLWKTYLTKNKPKFYG